jgi:hypothetical protein
MTNKNILTVGAVIAMLGGGAFAYHKIAKKRKENLAKREAHAYDKSTYNTGVSTINLVETSDTIANGLGINRGWYNPTSWSENDTDVYNAIRVVPKALISQLATIYANKYKRNLRSDLNEYLDSELYAKIKPLLV